MQQAWLVRPFLAGDKRNYTEEFLEKGFIALGPNNLPNLHAYNLDKLRKLLMERLGQEKLASGALAAVANNFVNKMQEMDLALLVNGQSVYALEIMSQYDYFYSKYVVQNFLCHRRSVRLMHTYSRDDLSLELRIALKSGRQIADISKHYAEVYKLCYGKELEETKTVVPVSNVEVSYPLRPDFQIKFAIPSDMTREESRRFEAFIKTLYFKEKQESGLELKIEKLHISVEEITKLIYAAFLFV